MALSIWGTTFQKFPSLGHTIIAPSLAEYLRLQQLSYAELEYHGSEIPLDETWDDALSPDNILTSEAWSQKGKYGGE
jgi:hypothetical protein